MCSMTKMQSNELKGSLRQRGSFRDTVEEAMPFYSVPMSQERAGTRGAAAGANFENLVLAQNKMYERAELGVVQKQFVKMVHAGRKGMIPVEAQTVDFQGFLTGVGHVSFDAKTTKEKVFRLEKRNLHQFLYLLRSQRWMREAQVRGAGIDIKLARDGAHILEAARFFYLIAFRELDTRHGSLAEKVRYYLVEDLEGMMETGTYEPYPEDEIVQAESKFLLDYRAKLLNMT
jgi:Recombination protein U